MKVILQNVRCSFVFLNEPRKSDKGNQDPKYSMQILIKKDDPQVKEIKAAIKKVAVDKFGSDVKMGMLKLPLRDGDEEREGQEYIGHYFLNANSKRRPGIVNRNNKPADTDDMEEMGYSGCYFHVSIAFFPFNAEGKKGIGVGLQNVMLRKKGDRLDGTTSATDEFSKFAEQTTGDDDWGDDDL